MTLCEYLAGGGRLLMEGALGTRLRSEYGLAADGPLAMAVLAETEHGRAALTELWRGYLADAERHGLGFMATTPTRRLNRERGAGREELFGVNMRLLRLALEGAAVPAFAGALMGCRGDAYTGAGALDEEEAYGFHAWAAEHFAAAGADFLFAGIMPSLPESLGMARAMAGTGLPYIISFTLRADGRLADGTLLADAAAAIDGAVFPPPLCYMSNCIHPRAMLSALEAPGNGGQGLRARFLGLQANASPLPPEQLDGAAAIQASDPDELAAGMGRLCREYGFRIFGGCCGTDGRHMEAIAAMLETESGRIPRPTGPAHGDDE